MLYIILYFYTSKIILSCHGTAPSLLKYCVYFSRNLVAGVDGYLGGCEVIFVIPVGCTSLRHYPGDQFIVI